MKHKIELSYWKKGMKIVCPECGKKVSEPYICKCGAELKPYVKMMAQEGIVANARQWPKDFVLDAKKREYAIEKGVDPRKVEDFWEDFHDWALESEVKRKDWNATFRMRVRKAKEWNLFQGKAIAIKTKPTAPNYLLTTAYYRLEKFGRANMLSYAKENKMTDDDIRSVEGKFEREQKGLDPDQLVGRIG